MREIIVNINGITDISENAERAFFNWLIKEKIEWRVLVTRINHIIIQEKDLECVKEKWPEILIVKR